MTERKKQLLRQFHTILSKNGLMKYKGDLLDSAGVESSKDLTENELLAFINDLNNDGDKWRKRVMAAIGNWLTELQTEHNSSLIKGIACRASGYKAFNDIPVSRLRDLYYGFSKKAKTTENISALRSLITQAKTTLN